MTVLLVDPLTLLARSYARNLDMLLGVPFLTPAAEQEPKYRSNESHSQDATYSNPGNASLGERYRFRVLKSAAVVAVATGIVEAVLVVSRLVVEATGTVDFAMNDLALEAVEELADIGEVGGGIDADGTLDVIELGEFSTGRC